MNFNEKTLTENYIYNGKILNLRRDKVELLNGKETYREIVEHSGGSCVYCEENDKILLVKQFRYAYKEELWEIPAGKLDKGEKPYKTAIRELEEECGIKAEEVELVFEIYPSPGYTQEKIYIYQAKNFTKTQKHLDEGEFLESYWIDKQTVKEMLKNGQIKDAKTIIALLYFLK